MCAVCHALYIYTLEKSTKMCNSGKNVLFNCFGVDFLKGNVENRKHKKVLSGYYITFMYINIRAVL